MKSDKTPLKYVWIICSSINEMSIGHRIFAKLGDKEISEAAYEIASNIGYFRNQLKTIIEGYIRDELTKGETQIIIEPEKEEDTTYYLYKASIDSGVDWAETNDAKKPDENNCKDVFQGSEIYVSFDYYGGVDALYSCKWLDEMEAFIVE